MAVRLNRLIPTKILWAAVTTAASAETVARMAAREEIPMDRNRHPQRQKNQHHA